MVQGVKKADEGKKVSVGGWMVVSVKCLAHTPTGRCLCRRAPTVSGPANQGQTWRMLFICFNSVYEWPTRVDSLMSKIIESKNHRATYYRRVGIYRRVN